MAELVPPTVTVEASYRAAAAEFCATDPRQPYDEDLPDFAARVARLLAASKEDSPRPAGYVPETTFWYVEGSAYLGRISVRHRLTEHLLEIGGHIGYDVRPTARRQGRATAMLQAVLPHVRGLGIDSALLTCNVDNVGSRKVIESAGGVLDDERNGKLRFWVPTATPPLIFALATGNRATRRTSGADGEDLRSGRAVDHEVAERLECGADVGVRQRGER